MTQLSFVAGWNYYKWPVDWIIYMASWLTSETPVSIVQDSATGATYNRGDPVGNDIVLLYPQNYNFYADSAFVLDLTPYPAPTAVLAPLLTIVGPEVVQVAESGDFSGRLEGNEPLPAQPVEAYRDGTHVGTVTTDVGGGWQMLVPFPDPGSYEVRAHYPGGRVSEWPSGVRELAVVPPGWNIYSEFLSKGTSWGDLTVFNYKAGTAGSYLVFRAGDVLSHVRIPGEYEVVQGLAFAGASELWVYVGPYGSRTGQLRLQRYALSGYPPTSMTLVEEQSFKIDSIAYSNLNPDGYLKENTGRAREVVCLPSGGLVAFFYEHIYGHDDYAAGGVPMTQTVGFIHRSPSGEWALMRGIEFDTPDANTEMNISSLSKHPLDGSIVWAFMHLDGAARMNAIGVRESFGALEFIAARDILRWPQAWQPYGENPRVLAVEDHLNGRILLAYNNAVYRPMISGGSLSNIAIASIDPDGFPDARTPQSVLIHPERSAGMSVIGLSPPPDLKLAAFWYDGVVNPPERIGFDTFDGTYWGGFNELHRLPKRTFASCSDPFQLAYYADDGLLHVLY